MKTPTMLLIMDGYGLAPKNAGNAIETARKPNIDYLMSKYPYTRINASEHFVGLPDGQIGNSEVGHTNMGAGRVIWQELCRISDKIKSGEFFKNEDLLAAFDNAKKHDSSVHLIGLLSDGGVHSHIEHLFALIDMAKKQGVSKVFVHAITDGRDVLPGTAKKYIEQTEEHLKKTGVGKIASVSGRYYAMDRDKRWERLILAYDCLTNGEGRSAASAAGLLEIASENGETDEFIIPGYVSDNGHPTALIKDNDSVIFFNFRPDRARQITRALSDPDFSDMQRKIFPKNLCYVCFTSYDATIPNVRIAFKPQSLKNTLGEYISSLGLKQLRIAETEKYAHVTFFFNGGIEEAYPGEDRVLIPSPKVATYDLKPEMSAYEVTESVLRVIDKGETDLIILNFANCDMVGHTGVFDAAVKAVEAVDECVGKICSAMLAKNGQVLLTADHGNADVMLAQGGQPMTAHTTNLVPVVLISDEKRFENAALKKTGALCDIAPTLLDMMKLQKPDEMEGQSLIETAH